MISSILVPLDGSEYSERALVVATELAKLSGARIHLLSVVLRLKQAHVAVLESLDERVGKAVDDYLAPHVERIKQARIDGVAHVLYGEPSEEIVNQAKESAADLIVMSTHGIGATGLHALGSIAMKVLQTAPCPVLMVRIPLVVPPAT